MQQAINSNPRYGRILRKPESLFLVISIFFGLLLVFTTPPAIVGDEPNHFFRAYQVSQGHLMAREYGDLRGGWLPKSVFETCRNLVGDIEFHPDVKFDKAMFEKYARMPLKASDVMFVGFANTAANTPVPYVPQAIAISIGRAGNLPPLAILYFARLFDLAAFVCMCFLAIRKIPTGKWMLCALLLTPATMFQAASASADASTFGICVLCISYFLAFANAGEGTLRPTDIAVLLLLSLLSVLSRSAYVLLPLLVFIIPREKFISYRWKIGSVLVIPGVCIAAAAAWALAVRSSFMPYRGDVYIDPDKQFSVILSNIPGFIDMAAAEYLNNIAYYFTAFFGQLTWHDLFVPAWLPPVLFVEVLALAFFASGGEAGLKISARVLFAAIAAGTAFIVAAMLYATWSEVGGDRIEGIQGRYFIPIAPLLFLLLCNQRSRIGKLERSAPLLVTAVAAVSICVTLYSIVTRYYI
jgi:uncharacterized membrane protein